MAPRRHDTSGNRVILKNGVETRSLYTGAMQDYSCTVVKSTMFHATTVATVPTTLVVSTHLETETTLAVAPHHQRSCHWVRATVVIVLQEPSAEQCSKHQQHVR